MACRLTDPALRLGLLALCLVCGAACGDGDSTGTPAPVATVAVTPNPVDVQVGATVQLTATLRDAQGNELTGRPVAWSSGAEAVATVDQNGLVTGLAEGPVEVTASSEGKRGKTVIAVVPDVNSPSGKRVIVGPGGKAPSTKVSEYSPLTQRWELTDLLQPLDPAGFALFFPVPSGVRLASVALGGGPRLGRSAATSGTVLFAGGAGQGNVISVRRAVLVDPVTGEASSRQMVAARVYFTLTPLPGNRALLAGGDSGTIGGVIATLASAEIFDLAGSQFTATGSMAQARSRHAAAPLPDGRVLVTGGLVPAGGGATDETQTTEIFDPVAGTFSPGPDMTVARFNHSAIALDDGRVLVLGGNRRRSAEVYDPATGAFTAVGDMEVVHGLGHRAVKLAGGKVLVLGGDLGAIQPSAVAEVFDPATDQFTRVADMTTARMLHFAVLLEGEGTVLVGGGQDDTGEVVASAELYDPVADKFTPVEDLPLPGSEQAAVFVPGEGQ